MSLEAVASPAGISATYLHKLERGVVNSPSPRVLARIAVVLETSYLDYLTLAGYLDEEQLAQANSREGSRTPHPLANLQLTAGEWREVGEFIEKLLEKRKNKNK